MAAKKAKKPTKTRKAKQEKFSERCQFCKVVFANDEAARYNFCYGCKTYVCDRCNVNFSLMGSHEPDDHLRDPDGEGEFDEGPHYKHFNQEEAALFDATGPERKDA